MRLEDEFALYEARVKEQGTKELAASIAREYNLPDSDADLLASHEDERMMRVLAERFAQDREVTHEEQIRTSVRNYRPLI